MRWFIGVLLAWSLAAAAEAQPASPWPGGHRAAIALTYDDALVSQLDVAVPQLDAAGFKGTFFLMGRQIGPNMLRWRAAAAEGHELGNHTINHPCSAASYQMAPQYTSESYSVPVLLTEIGVMNTYLEAIDGRSSHPFATPCGQQIVGGQNYVEALRGAGLTRYVRAASPQTQRGFDPFNVPCQFFGADSTAAQMIAYVENIRRQGGYAVLGFHGVGGDYLAVSGEAHQALLVYLKAHPDIWVGTFSDVMDAVAAHHGP
ncbi:MAG TPA: polysaccharide deacetylase family protein [Caulobacterales bacterium]|nr:polysaccharide deacetylase family protein [Caulobacterales bacterium]